MKTAGRQHGAFCAPRGTLPISREANGRRTGGRRGNRGGTLPVGGGHAALGGSMRVLALAGRGGVSRTAPVDTARRGRVGGTYDRRTAVDRGRHASRHSRRIVDAADTVDTGALDDDELGDLAEQTPWTDPGTGAVV